MTDYALKAVELLLSHNMKITTAESCTGGLIAKMITDISGSSSVFDCGIISYSNEIKNKILGVKKETLDTYGAVSEETVMQMAKGALEVSGADIAVAVSGIAGPKSDGTNKPVGLIHIAVATKTQTATKKLNNRFSVNIRENNRNSAATEALKLVCDILNNQGGVSQK